MSRSIITLVGQWTEGDNSSFTGTAKNLDGTVLDITDDTIEIIYWFEGEPPKILTGSVVSGAAGTFQAQFTEISTAPVGIPGHGVMHFIWRITENVTSYVYHSVNEYVIRVRKKARQAS